MISKIHKDSLSFARTFIGLMLLVMVLACGEDVAGTGAGVAQAPDDNNVTQQKFDDQVIEEETPDDPEIEEDPTTEDPPELVVELRVDGVSPEKGRASGGDTVTILGAGFGFDARVLFDESEALNTFVLGDDRINVTTPPHAPGLARITVFQSDGEEVAVLEDGYLYYNDVVVSEIEPASGPATGGTPVTIKGRGFTDDTKLLFGEQLAINTEVVDDSTILALTPTGMPGEVDVFVSNPVGLARLKKGFLYTAAPIVTKVVPVAGPSAGGQLTIIEGAGFVEPVEVRFTYDINGLLEVNAKVLSTGVTETVVIQNSESRLSDDEVAAALARISELKIPPSEQEANQALMARGERLFTEHLGQVRMSIAREIQLFEQALATQDRRLAEKAAREFEDFLNQFGTVL